MRSRTRFGWRAAGVAVCITAASLVALPRPEPVERTLEGLGAVDWEHWKNLEDLLSQVRRETGIPAIAAACVKGGRTVDAAVVGVRELGKPDPIRQDDRFHLGSVTKSLTATLIGKLAEQGVLSWSTTIGEVLGDVEMRPEYRAVTVEDLLQHRGGLPAYTDGLPQIDRQAVEAPGTPTESRAIFVAHLLGQPPVGRPGATFLYSNAGYTLLGCIAERLTGSSWEELVERHVYEPLGMKTGGFGFPEQPRGHRGRGPDFTVAAPGDHPSMVLVAPAGNAHASLADVARFAAFQLAGVRGGDGCLEAETVARLHTPVTEGPSAYAGGWFIRRDATGAEVHAHGGSVGSSYAEIRLVPEADVGVVLLMNVGPEIGEPVANRIARAVLARHGPATSAREEGAAPGGFERARVAGSGETVTLLEGPEDDPRSFAVIRQLCLTLNDEDFDAFAALFAPRQGPKADEPRQVFEFMTREVFPHRGGIRALHAISRPVQVPGAESAARFVVFHLENGYPGYVGVSLDEAGKIDHFSLFVKSDLCPNGPDPQCSEVVTRLDGAASP